MKKYIYLSIVLLLIVFGLYGCEKKQDDKENKENIGVIDVYDYPTKDDNKEETETENGDKEDEIDDHNQVDATIDKEELLRRKDIIFDWLTKTYSGYRIEEDFKLPIKHPEYDMEIEFYSFDTCLSSDGKYNPPLLDFDSEVLFLIIIGKEEFELFLPVTFVGNGDEFDVVYYELKSIIPSFLTTSIYLYNSLTGHDAIISWKSNTPDVIEDDGTIHRDMKENRKGQLVCSITISGETREFTIDVTVSKVSDIEKIGFAKEWLDNNFSINSEINGNIDLPKTLEEYDARFLWESSSPLVLSSNGEYSAPFIDEDIILSVNVVVGVRSETLKYTVKAKAPTFNNIWEKIESFLDKINVKQIKNQKFYLYGSEEGYSRVPTQNIGYLPFYDEEEMVIVEDFLPRGSGLKPDSLRRSTEYIVVHNTGMAAPTATAKGLNDYIHSTTRQASWHFSIDDKETYQHVPLNEVAWHAGDSGRYFGEVWEGGIGGGNQNGVAIETCVYEGIDFNTCMRRLAKLVASLLIKYNLGFDRVKKHYDFSGKDCPQVIMHAGRWDELMSLIKLEHFAQTELKDVHFEWISLSPLIIDDKGVVINHPSEATNINYKVIVTYNGEVREYYYSSLLLKLED